MTPQSDPRRVGRDAVRSLVTTLEERLAELLARDPERMRAAVDAGLVSEEWLEHPGEAPITRSTPVGVVRRFLERSVAQRPSTLAALGLSAVQVLSGLGEGVTRGAGRPEHLAVVFTDLEGFTTYTASEGDEVASAFLEEHQAKVASAVRARGGQVVQHIGDGSFLTFPVADAAVLASLELVDRCRDPLPLRAGVHVGDVIVRGDSVVGNAVNLAARVSESARGGEVWVTADVCEAADGLPGVSWGRVRRRRFKGIDGPTRVCRARLVPEPESGE